MVEKCRAEKSGVEVSLNLKNAWLKSLGLKALRLKLGVEKSGIEMSFNRHYNMRCKALVPNQKVTIFYWWQCITQRIGGPSVVPQIEPQLTS